MMDQERFEELLLAEIDGRLTLDQRAQLDAVCEHDSALNRLRRHDLRIARMVRSISPTRVPQSLALDVMRRYDMEIAGEREQERYEEPVPAARAPYEEDPFETTSSGRRYREVYEPYREPVAVRSATPWWSMILGSTFMRLSFAMSVMIVCIYMGSVIVRQSRSGNGSLIPGFGQPEFPQISNADNTSESAVAGNLPPAEPTPAFREVQIARLDNPNPTAIDLNALAEITPLPATDDELADDAVEAKTEAESVGKMDPAIEKRLGGSSDADAKAQSATMAAIAAVDSKSTPVTEQPNPAPAAASAPTTAPQPAPVAVVPVMVAQQSKPQVDLPEAVASSASTPAVDEKVIASASSAPQAEVGAGMEKVFERIKDDLDSQHSPATPTASTPPGAREVKDADELRTALAERKVATAEIPQMPAAAPPAKSSASSTHTKSEVDELRETLAGQSTAARGFKSSPTKSAAPAVLTPLPSAETTIAKSSASSSAVPQNAMVPENKASTKSSSGDRLRKIELAIVRNKGTILGRRPDSKDPSTTRVKVLMTRAQIRALEKDLAQQGLAPAKKSSDDSAAADDKPIEFEILVKSR